MINKITGMNKNTTLAIFLIVTFLFSAVTQAQTWQWAKQVGGPRNDYAGGIDIDANGNSYVTGRFYDSASFGAITLYSPGAWSVFIAKYDVNGQAEWAKIAATGANIKVNAICKDVYGRLSITGLYKDSASFGTVSPFTLYSVADYDVFIASYNSTGDVIWARSAGGQGFDYSSAVSSDALGDLFIAGEFHISSYSGSASKVFVAKYDSSGNNLWLTQELVYHNFHQGNDLKTSPDGTSYITGQFFDTLSFDPTTALGAGNIEANIFIAKISDSGTVLWLQRAGAGTGYTSGNAIDIDAAGNAYITGFYRGTVAFDTINLAGPAGISYDIYVAKCNANGHFLWVNKASGPSDTDNGVRICVDNNGSCFIAGNFNGLFTLDTFTLNSMQQDIYLARVDSTGAFTWADQCGGSGFDHIAGIRSNNFGLFLAGDFNGTGVFGPLPSLAGDSTDIFVARIFDATPEAVRSVSKDNRISISPNPVADELQLTAAGAGSRYSIYDISGRVINTGNIATTNRVSVSGLEQGMYFIRIADKDNKERVEVLRFIKD